MRRRHVIQSASLYALAGVHVSSGLAREGSGAYAWQSVPFGGGGFIDGFVFHPREPGLLYARTDIGGAYRFEPTSASWVPLLDHMSRADADLTGVLSLALDPNDPNRLYAACGLYLGPAARDGALLASVDRGATWQVHELGIKLGGNSPGRGSGERLQVDPNQGEILLLGSSQDGLLKSADRGKTFSRLAFPARHVSLVLFDAKSGVLGKATPTLYAGSHDQPGLYVSHDGGRSFAREPGTPAQAPQRAAFGADGTLYVSFALGETGVACNPSYATTGGVWRRDKRGHWADISPVKPSDSELSFGYSGLDVDSRVPGRLVVSTIERWKPGDDLFLSTDDGATWTPLGARSRHDTSPYPWLVNYLHGKQEKMGHWIADLKIDPQNSERTIYGTGYGLWITHNLSAAARGGVVNWDFTVSNFEETATLEVKSPPQGPRLLGAMGDVSGAGWSDPSQTPRHALFAPTNETNRGVDFAELAPAVMARTSDHAATGGYRSSDGGLSWQPFGATPHMAKSPTGHRLPTGSVAVSARATAFVWVPEKGPALCSLDRGQTWKLSAGWPADREVALQAVADRAVDGVFYVHDRANGQILASADGGQRFKPAITGLPRLGSQATAQLICAPGAPRDLWLALPSGLLHIARQEASPRALPSVAEAWMVALGKGAPNAPYHSLYLWGRVRSGTTLTEGLFRSDDAGASFQRINDDSHRYGLLLSMAADAREHGTVYLAAHGRGIIVGRPRSA